ncbi:hypothetical protein ACJX0J_031946 [Zea mays]
MRAPTYPIENEGSSIFRKKNQRTTKGNLPYALHHGMNPGATANWVGIVDECECIVFFSRSYCIIRTTQIPIAPVELSKEKALPAQELENQPGLYSQSLFAVLNTDTLKPSSIHA